MEEKDVCGLAGIVSGIIESNTYMVTGYPGGPISPIVEMLADVGIPHVEWSVNEKQAVAQAIGAAVMGKRAAAIMKHVGVNVASDAIMGAALDCNPEGGLVIIAGDDPGGFSSQNEQDSRIYTKLFNIPMFEPSTPQEAKQMVKTAFRFSEKYKIPVILRLINKLKNLRGRVSFENTTEVNKKTSLSSSGYFQPGNIPQKHKLLIKKIKKVASKINTLNYDQKISGDMEKAEYGVITSGPISREIYIKFKEDQNQVAIFKIGSINPLPLSKLKEFIQQLTHIMVVEEGEPFIEEQILNIAIPGQKIYGKLTEDIPYEGSLDIQQINRIIEEIIRNKGISREEHIEKKIKIQDRKPIWEDTKGCPMKPAHQALNRALEIYHEEVVVIGDTGCVSEGVYAPYESIDAFVCMGVSASVAGGISLTDYTGRAIAVMGDSSFLHSGIQAVINAVYNKTEITFIVFDNGITGETGRQPNPGTGKTIRGDSVPQIKIKELINACQVDSCKVLNPFEVNEVTDTILSYLNRQGVNVLILRALCPEKCQKN